MTTKQCFKCKKILPLELFYKHPMMADGRVNKCKECNKADVRNNRADKLNYYLEYDRARANIPKRVNARSAYSNTANGKLSHSLSKKKWIENNLLKRSASTIIGNAIRDGKLTKQYACSVCGEDKKRIHGHHDDYAYPMTVRWLCQKCHIAWHKLNGSGVNG